MKEKVYTIKTRGSSKDKDYQYVMRCISGVNLEDLIALLGPEAAVRLFKFYGGTYMYIPSVKTIRKRINEALVKDRCVKLLKEGKTRKEIIDLLHRESGYSKNTLKMKMVRWFGESGDEETAKIAKAKDAFNDSLVEAASRYYDIFKSYGIL